MVSRRGGSNRGGRGGGGGRGTGGRPPGGGGRGSGGRGHGGDDRGRGGDRGREGNGGRRFGPRGDDRTGLPRRQPPAGRGGGRGYGGERGGAPGYREERPPARFGGGRPGRPGPAGRGYDGGERFGPPPRQPGGRPPRPAFDVEYEGGRVGTGASAGREYIWGRNAVMEALGAGRTIHRILLAPNVRAAQRLDRVLDDARERGIPIVSTPAERIEQISPHAQGIVAEVEPFRYYAPEDLLELAHFRGEPPTLLALDQIEDPQNLGTLLRTAEAVGVHGVLIPEHRAAQVTGSVVKASAGAAQYLRVARVTNLKRELEALKAQGIWVIGIEADGEQAFDEVTLDLPFVLVVGGEDRGLGRTVRETCDVVLRIPTVGKVGSLNAATAGSIVLYHLWRTRQKHLGTAVSSGDVHLAEDAGYEIPPTHETTEAPRAGVDEYGSAESHELATRPERARQAAAEVEPETAPAEAVSPTAEAVSAEAAPKPKRGRAAAAAPVTTPDAEAESTPTVDAPTVAPPPSEGPAEPEAAADATPQAKPKRARKTASAESAEAPAAPPKRTRKPKAADSN